MKCEMPWLQDRLRAIGKTPAGLSRHLGLRGPRVYEMLLGRRAMQPNEIEPTAEYVGWTVEELLAHLPEKARVVPAKVHVGPGMIPVLVTRRNEHADCLLTGETTYTRTALAQPADVHCLYMHSHAMAPWRQDGEPVLFDSRPPKAMDYVVICLAAKGTGKTPQAVIIRQLISQRPASVTLRQHNPTREAVIRRATIEKMFRVLAWEDVVR